MGVGGSGLKELLVHVGAEGSTGGQRPAHKLLCHVPGEGAMGFQVLGPQGQSVCRGRGVEGSTWVPNPLSSVSAVLPRESQEPPPGNSPSRTGSVVLEWVVVMLYSPGIGCWKSPKWLPSCGKGPGVGRGASQGWCQETAWPEKGCG